jgi:hypothetical protein
MNRWVTAVAVLALAVLGVRLAAQHGRRPDAVTMVPGGRPAGDDPGRKGATYYALERASRRVVTHFSDGTQAVAERGVDGDLLTSLQGADANEINRLRVDRTAGQGDIVQYALSSGDPIQLLMAADVHPTLDWANRQAHQLYVDRVADGADLHWQGGLVRRRAAAVEVPELGSVRSVETQWTEGLSAITGPVHSKQGDLFNGQPVQGDVLVTKLMRDGVEIGVANYLTHERIYSWRIPGVTEGTLAAEHLAARYGGWPFTPDMIWMNLQAIALYQMKSEIDRSGFVARQQPPSQSPLGAIGQFFAPTVSADEPGCDDLHWLDGTVLRFCCDVHDFCYAKYGCDSSSWWRFWSSWTCDACNGTVVWCFATGGTMGPFYRSPW